MNQNEGKSEMDIKVMLIGDQAVGKSSLMVRYTEDTFYMNMLGTAGIDFKKKIITTDENKIKVTVFDTAGHERFRKINKSYYRNVKGIILVYDITDRQTFENVTVWMNSILENAEKDKLLQLLILGNKFDMIEERNVSTEEGKQVAEKYNALFTETSAKTGENVDSAFNMVIEGILSKENSSIDKVKTSNEKNGAVEKEEIKVEVVEPVSKAEPDNNKALLTQQNPDSEKVKLSTEASVDSPDKKKKKKNCFCN
jgi:Ras-related protein Rab-1A